jgi:hypothetical protein
MTQFNPENKKTLTYKDCLSPAMQIVSQADAQQYLEAYIKYQEANMQEASGEHTPEEICKINLGYYAGYYDRETQVRVERLFNCTHPIFGSTKKQQKHS